MADNNNGILALMVAAGAAMAVIGSGKLFKASSVPVYTPPVTPPVTPTTPPTPTPPAGTETMSDPWIPALEGAAPINLTIGYPLPLPLPLVKYTGPGRDAFTYARIRQNGKDVYGSGLAGIHIGGGVAQIAGMPDTYPLVAVDQVQPYGWLPQTLGLMPYPGPAPTHFPGVQAQPGLADIWLEIYQRDGTSTDGFASPLENGRLAVKRKVYPGKVQFFAPQQA